MTKEMEYYILVCVIITIMFSLCVDVLARNYRKGHSAPLTSNLHELSLDPSDSADADVSVKQLAHAAHVEPIEAVYPMYIDCSRRTA
ncbi:hypothetical protein [Paenibacillus aestuarii]|uniref:Uncharacterized protein n=1 Tax=Paenibacillus aestuarii TaxID=516965 RepID=A0ABW0K309_9BACL|nr:hypothetical protein [Paenibacillus aestuarii]